MQAHKNNPWSLNGDPKPKRAWKDVPEILPEYRCQSDFYMQQNYQLKSKRKKKIPANIQFLATNKAVQKVLEGKL